ncbi:hypothetical protein Z950_2978 [Sulfitobacter mediterraneus KCTC 32188]|nr:hypothetical protein Z950_2978 [Sulfitobacter mediterraneus KCTC 32188]
MPGSLRDFDRAFGLTVVVGGLICRGESCLDYSAQTAAE